MIKQLLQLGIANYHNLSVSRRSVICFSLQLGQLIDLLATNKSQYFAPHPIIVNYCKSELKYNDIEPNTEIHLFFEKGGDT